MISLNVHVGHSVNQHLDYLLLSSSAFYTCTYFIQLEKMNTNTNPNTLLLMME